MKEPIYPVRAGTRFFKYLKAQSKRAVRVYPAVLIFTLILSACLVIFLGQMFDSNGAAKMRTKIGIVGDMENSLGLGVPMIAELDSSNAYVEFLEMDEAKAKADLSSGDIYGYIRIPEGFVQAMGRGESMHLKYITLESPSTVTPMLVREVLDIISDFLTESQNGFFGIEIVAKEFDKRAEFNDDNEAINLMYLDAVFSRNDSYSVVNLGVGNGFGFTEYYIIAFVVLMLMLWGIAGAVFLIKNDMSLPRLLKSNGHSNISQVLGDYIPFFAMMFINLLILMAAVGFLPTEQLDLSFSYAVASPTASLITAVKLMPVAALISALQFFLYELTSNTISAVLTQLLCTISLAYVSGFLYPLNSLPSALQSIAGYLPTGVAFNYTSAVFVGSVSPGKLGALAGYFVLFTVLSAVVREYKMRSSKI